MAYLLTDIKITKKNVFSHYMRLAEFAVFLLLLALLVWPDSLKRVPMAKLGLVAVIVYLGHVHIGLGCLAAVVLLRVLYEAPTNSWRPPRMDRLGLDTLLRPQESFFRPTLRTAGDPVAEIPQPYTLF